MAHIVADRVMETSTTTGTGAFTLAGAYTGYQRFSAVCSTSDTVYYCIEAIDANGNPSGDWESGLGTYSSANTLTRTTPSASSNAGAAVNFAAGTKRVTLAPTASRISSFVVQGAVTGSGLTQATSRLLGRTTASSGAIEEISVGTGLSLASGSLTKSFSGALVTKAADHTAANYSANPNVTWDTEAYDTDSYHSTSSNTDRLTCPTAGKYRIGGQICVASGTLTASDYVRIFMTRFNSSSVEQSFIGLPSSVITEVSSAGPNISVLGWSAFIDCSAGDYFTLSFDTEADTSITVAGSGLSWFAIERA